MKFIGESGTASKPGAERWAFVFMGGFSARMRRNGNAPTSAAKAANFPLRTTARLKPCPDETLPAQFIRGKEAGRSGSPRLVRRGQVRYGGITRSAYKKKQIPRAETALGMTTYDLWERQNDGCGSFNATTQAGEQGPRACPRQAGTFALGMTTYRVSVCCRTRERDGVSFHHTHKRAKMPERRQRYVIALLHHRKAAGLRGGPSGHSMLCPYDGPPGAASDIAKDDRDGVSFRHTHKQAKMPERRQRYVTALLHHAKVMPLPRPTGRGEQRPYKGREGTTCCAPTNGGRAGVATPPRRASGHSVLAPAQEPKSEREAQ